MTIDSKNLLVAIKAYSRANPLPLDASEVHDSLSAAQEYAASAKAYPGQTIKVLQNGVYETYVLNPGNNGLTLGHISGSAPAETKTGVQVVEELPSIGQEQGVIYITPDLKGQIWVGSEWKVVFEQIELNDINKAVETLTEEIETIQESIGTLYADATIEGSVDYKIAQALVNAGHLRRKVVTELPQEDIDENAIYMISVRVNGEDIYDEYMFIDGQWEVLGNTSIDLSDYYTKEEADSTFATIAALAEYALKSELPSVPTKVSELENDLGFLTEHQDLGDYALKSDIPDTSEFAKTNDLQNYVTLGAYNETVKTLQDGQSALAGLFGNAATKQELNDVKQNYALKTEIPTDYATEDFVIQAINEAKLEGGDSSNIDLSIYALKSDLGNYSGYENVVDYVNAAIGTMSVRIVEF